MFAARGHSSKRAFWDLAICGAGLVYLALALFLNLESPVFGVVLIILAGYELLGNRVRRRGGSPAGRTTARSKPN